MLRSKCTYIVDFFFFFTLLFGVDLRHCARAHWKCVYKQGACCCCWCGSTYIQTPVFTFAARDRTRWEAVCPTWNHKPQKRNPPPPPPPPATITWSGTHVNIYIMRLSLYGKTPVFVLDIIMDFVYYVFLFVYVVILGRVICVVGFLWDWKSFLGLIEGWCVSFGDFMGKWFLVIISSKLKNEKSNVIV